MRADKLCQANKVETTVIPVPEKISGQCGMCLRLADENLDNFVALMNANKIEHTVYEL